MGFQEIDIFISIQYVSNIPIYLTTYVYRYIIDAFVGILYLYLHIDILYISTCIVCLYRHTNI